MVWLLGAKSQKPIQSTRKALFAALGSEEDHIEAHNLLSKINLYFT